jgi:septin family protein
MLYFFGSGHHPNSCDFKILQTFQKIVNVIPIIARADIFKSEELYKMKIDIITQASERNVKFFDCDEAIQAASKVCYSF